MEEAESHESETSATSGAEAIGAAGVDPVGIAAGASGIDPIAAALALGGASREKADAFLDDQRAFLHKQGDLISDQRHYVHERYKQLVEQVEETWLRIWALRLGLLLRLATAAVGLAIVLGLVVLAWNASRADGLVVESFSVPPTFVQAGIGGGIVADDFTHKIEAIRDRALSLSTIRAKNVSKEGGEDIKVEIPETGVSLGEAWHYMRLWLGHERQISGNLRSLSDNKIALTVSLSGGSSFTQTGPLGTLDELEHKAAEQVFSEIDPFNYVLYLSAVGRHAETLAFAARLPQLVETPKEIALAYAVWAAMIRIETADMASTIAHARIAITIDPTLVGAPREILLSAALLGHDEEVLKQARLILPMRKEDQAASLTDEGFKDYIDYSAFVRDSALGDYAKVASQQGGCLGCTPTSHTFRDGEYAARDHDVAASRDLIEQASQMEPLTGPMAHSSSGGDPHRARYYLDAARGDWPGAVREAQELIDALRTDPTAAPRVTELRIAVLAQPLLAYALARSGNFVAAHAAINRSPPDCYLCLRTRGRIEAEERNWTGAAYWFNRAVHDAPSIPFAYTDWGRMLLHNGDPDGAMVQLARAHEKGPHFADALELWGEALMAKNHSHFAVAKFAEADKYAPNWGGLHLKWAEALGYAGRNDEAQAQYLKASTLGLTAAEKAELARQSPHA
jgi:hypothetical protein